MKTTKNLRTICLSVVAMALIVTLSVGTALAYFTTHTSAKGGITLNLEFAYAKIHEDVEVGEDAGYKKITIENVGKVDCYVRMKAFAGCDLIYSASTTDKTVPVDGWTLKDGYYEYNSILKPGKTTETPIYVHFNVPNNIDAFNVIVIQECTPVLHDNDGKELPAKWDTKTGDPITFLATVSDGEN